MRRAVLILLLALTGCATPITEDSEMNDNTLTTSDGLKIAYDYYEPKQSAPDKPGVILLHMLRRTKADWKPFAGELQKLDYPTIAIDFRGHGKSDKRWEEFTDNDFRKMTLDVAAASKFLQEKGAKTVVIFGASIGANTALNYGVGAAEVKATALLSPGLDYRGVRTEDAARKNKKPILLIAAQDDEYSAESVDALSKLTNATVHVYPSGGHGTQLFATTDLQVRLIGWLTGLH